MLSPAWWEFMSRSPPEEGSNELSSWHRVGQPGYTGCSKQTSGVADSQMVDTCACGDAVTKGGTRCGRCAALRVLGLEYGASDDEIKDTFRVLAKVWHPDRFESDKKLRTIAEEKLKELNSAFQLLTIPTSTQVPRDPSRGKPPSRPSEPPEPQTEQSQPKPQEQEPRTEWRSASAAAPKPPTPENRSQQNSTPAQQEAIRPQPTSVSVGNSGWGRVLPTGESNGGRLPASQGAQLISIPTLNIDL